MIEELFTRKFLMYLLVILFIMFSIIHIANFYGIEVSSYMTYLYVYIAFFIAYLLLPHSIPKI